MVHVRTLETMMEIYASPGTWFMSCVDGMDIHASHMQWFTLDAKKHVIIY